MSATASANLIESLFTKALRSKGDIEVLNEVRKMSSEILDALETSDKFSPSEEELETIDPSWIANVYEALSGIEDEKIQDNSVFWATADREESIGIAFKEALMIGIPEKLQKLYEWPASIATEDKEDKEDLLSTPAADAARPYSEYFAEYGLTPISIFYATDTISYLIERLAEQKVISQDAQILLDEEFVEVGGKKDSKLTLELIIDDIAQSSACMYETAKEIYKWLIQVAQYKPFLFPGFLSKPVNNRKGVCLIKTSESYENLFQRWGLSETNTHQEELYAYNSI